MLSSLLTRTHGLDGRCFLVPRFVSTSVLRTRMTDRNQICPNGKASTVTDVLARPYKWQTPYLGRGDASKRIVYKFRRPTILQLNIEGLTASKMSIIYCLAAQREALVILLQETHCTSAKRLVLPDYQLAGFSLSRKHGLATFVHEQLKWALFDQSPPTSETKWLCVDVDGYQIVNVYKPSPIRLQASDLPVSHIPVSMLMTLIASMLIGVMMPTVQIENAWLVRQVPKILLYFITQRMPASFHSGRWNTSTSPDLAFVSIDSDSRLPDIHCLRKVPKVSTLTLAYYSTQVCSSCTKQACKAMELPQGQVEPLYYSHKQTFQDLTAT